ncbi:MAG: hypothetical protein HUJ62_00480 [Streptococcus gallolyticus]|nr:hypothetical protein [Streptococcus gallolyticus]
MASGATPTLTNTNITDPSGATIENGAYGSYLNNQVVTIEIKKPSLFKFNTVYTVSIATASENNAESTIQKFKFKQSAVTISAVAGSKSWGNHTSEMDPNIECGDANLPATVFGEGKTPPYATIKFSLNGAEMATSNPITVFKTKLNTTTYNPPYEISSGVDWKYEKDEFKILSISPSEYKYHFTFDSSYDIKIVDTNGNKHSFFFKIG